MKRRTLLGVAMALGFLALGSTASAATHYCRAIPADASVSTLPVTRLTVSVDGAAYGRSPLARGGRGEHWALCDTFATYEFESLAPLWRRGAPASPIDQSFAFVTEGRDFRYRVTTHFVSLKAVCGCGNGYLLVTMRGAPLSWRARGLANVIRYRVGPA